MIYRNFTEAFKDMIKGPVAEIGPGFYCEVAISLIQNIPAIDKYLVIDGALDHDDAFERFNQAGGVSSFLECLKKYDDAEKSIMSKINSILAYAHQIPIKSSSLDSIIFFKSLFKIVDGGFTYYTKDFKKLSPKIYKLLVLEEARRIGNKIILVSESKLLEGELMKDLEMYAKALNQEIEIIKVEKPTFLIDEKGKTFEVGHWQDVVNPSKKIIVIKTSKKELLLEDLEEYLQIKDVYLEDTWKKLVRYLGLE